MFKFDVLENEELCEGKFVVRGLKEGGYEINYVGSRWEMEDGANGVNLIRSGEVSKGDLDKLDDLEDIEFEVNEFENMQEETNGVKFYRLDYEAQRDLMNGLLCDIDSFLDDYGRRDLNRDCKKLIVEVKFDESYVNEIGWNIENNQIY